MAADVDGKLLTVTFLAMMSVRTPSSSWNANAEKVLGGATTEPATSRPSSRPSKSMAVDADMASGAGHSNATEVAAGVVGEAIGGDNDGAGGGQWHL